MLLPQAHSGPRLALPHLTATRAASSTDARGWDEFETFFRATYPKLVAQLHALTGNADEAASAAQYALGRAWRQWSRVARSADPAAWLRAEANEELARPDWRRHPELRTPGPGVLDPVSRIMLDALGTLTHEHRQAVVLADMARVPMRQLADEIGASSGGAFLLVGQARTALVRELAATGGPVGLSPGTATRRHRSAEEWVTRQLSVLQFRIAPRTDGPGLLADIRSSDRYRRVGAGSVVAMTLLAGLGTAVAVSATKDAVVLPELFPSLRTSPAPRHALPHPVSPTSTAPNASAPGGPAGATMTSAGLPASPAGSATPGAPSGDAHDATYGDGYDSGPSDSDGARYDHDSHGQWWGGRGSDGKGRDGYGSDGPGPGGYDSGRPSARTDAVPPPMSTALSTPPSGGTGGGTAAGGGSASGGPAGDTAGGGSGSGSDSGPDSGLSGRDRGDEDSGRSERSIGDFTTGGGRRGGGDHDGGGLSGRHRDGRGHSGGGHGGGERGGGGGHGGRGHGGH